MLYPTELRAHTSGVFFARIRIAGKLIRKSLKTDRVSVAKLRLADFEKEQSSTPLIEHSYGYDNASRLQSVTDETGATPYSATYGYLANSPLVEQITFKENTTTRMITTKAYDNLNRLSAVGSSAGSTVVSSHDYTYNSANQRTRATLADGSYWLYEYDALGQVKSGRKYWSDGSPVAGQQFTYAHDDIGNRASAASGGDENGFNLRTASYTRNRLNQYTQRTVPGYVDVKGIALATATVTVNSQGTYRKGEYFRKELSVANSSAPVWQSLSVAATGETTVDGNVFVPKTAEVFTHDNDGNLTQDGRWTYTWDAENRLIKVESLTSAPTASKRKVEWTYDYRGRRIRQITSNGSSGSYVVTEDLKFVSDPVLFGRHIAELNYSNNALVRSYVWGLDLSGTLDGAGGVGGLLMVNSSANGAHFCAYDGNGNVTALVKGTDGTVSAAYEYDPFGQTIRMTGAMAKESPFRFSTKRTDNTTDLVLYEYRVYSPGTGRWPNRDPIGELAFFTHYTSGKLRHNTIQKLIREGLKPSHGFVSNSPVNRWDRNGLVDLEDDLSDPDLDPDCQQKADDIKDGLKKRCRQLDDPKVQCCLTGRGFLGMRPGTRMTEEDVANLRERCRNLNKIKIWCMLPGQEDTGCGPGTCAYVSRIAKEEIVLCPPMFEDGSACSKFGMDCVLLHELWHTVQHYDEDGSKSLKEDEKGNRVQWCLCRNHGAFHK